MQSLPRTCPPSTWWNTSPSARLRFIEYFGKTLRTLKLELLHLVTVENLYAFEEFMPCIAPALRELVGEEGLKCCPPSLQISWRSLQQLGAVQEVIGQFVVARQFSGPLAIFSL